MHRITARLSKRDVHWLGFFALLLAAWAMLALMSAPPAAGPWFARFAVMCATPAATAGFPVLWAMWALMAAAMMAPGMLPALATYDDLRHSGAATRGGFGALLAGYLGVWLVYSAAGALLQQRLGAQGLMAGDASSSALVNAALLGIAGVYQFSALKYACVSRCRAPLTFFMQHWRPGPAGALHMGIRLGAVCVGCCWALMLLGLVGGTMNLLWMGLATLFMVLEKLPQAGRLLTAPAGILLIFFAAFETGRALY